jgi:uncharacterized membrane protein
MSTSHHLLPDWFHAFFILGPPFSFPSWKCVPVKCLIPVVLRGWGGDLKTIIILVAILSALLPLASQQAAMLITIDRGGVAEAHLSLSAVEGLNEVRLPAEPIPETIWVRVNGEYVAPIYENGVLYFFSRAPGDAEIDYMINISARNDILSFEVNWGNLTRLRIPPQVILLTVPRNITGMEYVEGDLVIEFYGPERIEYAVRTFQPTTTATKTGAATITKESITTITSLGASTAASTTTMGTGIIGGPTTATMAQATGTYTITGPPGISQVMIIVGLAALMAIAVAAAVAYSRSRSRGLPHEDHSLTGLDRMILEAIGNAGGSILQGELQTSLNLPKTTLWRRVRRLEKLGYIQIVKEGAFNRLILLKKPD